MDYKEIRKAFKEGDDIRDSGLTTPEDIVRFDNISYGPYGNWNLLDVYRPKAAGTMLLPVIISVHGGGWVYGDKDRYQYYCMNLAQRGFTVVNYTYRLAPEYPFPAALEDANAVFCWVQVHAEEYHMDLTRLFTVGDSAGGQLSAQYNAILSNPEYAEMFDLELPAIKVRACALNCGHYEFAPPATWEETGMSVEMCYFGENPEKIMPLMNIIGHVTSNFPPTFLMTAYYDFLKEQAAPVLRRLEEQGVPCEYRVYGNRAKKYMGHVFHLNLRLKEAKVCNDEECEFFLSVS